MCRALAVPCAPHSVRVLVCTCILLCAQGLAVCLCFLHCTCIATRSPAQRPCWSPVDTAPPLLGPPPPRMRALSRLCACAGSPGAFSRFALGSQLSWRRQRTEMTRPSVLQEIREVEAWEFSPGSCSPPGCVCVWGGAPAFSRPHCRTQGAMASGGGPSEVIWWPVGGCGGGEKGRELGQRFTGGGGTPLL